MCLVDCLSFAGVVGVCACVCCVVVVGCVCVLCLFLGGFVARLFV